MEAAELTSQQEVGAPRGLGGQGEVLHNPMYEDSDEGEEVEMLGMADWSLPPPPSSSSIF